MSAGIQNPPLVLPMYHIGMHQIASETPIHKRGRGELSKIIPNRGEFWRVCWAGWRFVRGIHAPGSCFMWPFASNVSLH